MYCIAYYSSSVIQLNVYRFLYMLYSHLFIEQFYYFLWIILLSYIIHFFPSWSSLHEHPTICPSFLSLTESTHQLLPHLFSILLFWAIKPPEEQVAPLLLMPDKAGTDSWIVFGWWLVPVSSEGVWLVDIVVLPMGLHSTSAPSVLPLTLWLAYSSSG